MNILENVKLNSDSGLYVAPRYTVIEASVSSNPATTYLWLKCVSYGFTDESNFAAYKASVINNGMADKSQLVGPCGTYIIANLSDVVTYTRPYSFDHEFNFPSIWQLG
jgi:hypothetical protein